MATFIILIIIAICVWLAIRSLHRNNGHSCSSCNGCHGCNSCNCSEKH